ncbi:hypothetical protein [Thauera sp.]|jgi:hypothetical protein|uniref:hypothetical protein n=1 Tax=Thauera sp. TaxID=1905334 RepID=UPI002A35C0B2|nr:hypothetical protein [Thauera sp.]MDX9885149.1 hypothetical protein [Thauera sp.]
MHPTQPADRTAQRRKLLKGALGASAVATLGYSRTAAAASITACIANFPELSLPAEQFVNSGSELPPEGNGLAWKGVFVQYYSEKLNSNGQNGGKKFYAVQIGDQLYPVADGLAGPGTGGLASLVPVTGFPSDQPSGFPRQAWTLVYFSDATRDEIGLYPNVAAPAGGVAPASLACLSSLNADLSGDYTFGG